jgi:ligand-binding sensor domain-containing protein
LWIGTDDGLNLFNRQTNSFTRFKHQPGQNTSLSSNIITSIAEDVTGNLWVGTYGGLNLFDGKN